MKCILLYPHRLFCTCGIFISVICANIDEVSDCGNWDVNGNARTHTFWITISISYISGSWVSILVKRLLWNALGLVHLKFLWFNFEVICELFYIMFIVIEFHVLPVCSCFYRVCSMKWIFLWISLSRWACHVCYSLWSWTNLRKYQYKHIFTSIRHNYTTFLVWKVTYFPKLPSHFLLLHGWSQQTVVMVT